MKNMTNSAAGKGRGLSGNGMAAFDFSSILRSIPSLTQVPSLEEKRTLRKKAVAPSSVRRRPLKNNLKSLAEAIILQSIQDLWSKTHQKESIEFFTGDGFRQCADMAGMSVVDRLRLMRMLRKVNAGAFLPRHTQKLAHVAKSF